MVFYAGQYAGQVVEFVQTRGILDPRWTSVLFVQSRGGPRLAYTVTSPFTTEFGGLYVEVVCPD